MRVAICFLVYIAWLGNFSQSAATGVAFAKEGTSYYVDSTIGADQNSGTTPATAWRTLAKVNATSFHPGDHILFKSGSIFTGQLWPKGSGTEHAPIIIDQYGDGPKPVINAAGESADAVLLKNQEYWEINDLAITNVGSHAGSRRGVNLIADNSSDLHHIYLRKLDIHDVNGSDDDKANGGINYHCIGDSRPSRFVDLRIEDNHISHVDRSGIFGWSSHWQRSKWYPSLNVVIRDNVLDDIGGDGIVPVATEGALIEHNVVSHANQRSAGYNVGIWPWSADNTVVQFNEVYGTKGQRDGEGFDSDWNSRNTIIQYNYSHDNDGGFLLICNDGSQSATVSVGNSGTIVRYNVSQNDHNRGFNISGPVSNTTIYNNTIYVGKREKVELVVWSDWHGWADATAFYNNIFYVDGQARFSYAISRGADGAYVTNLGVGASLESTFDYNLYFGNLSSPANDRHAITADPLFVAPGGATTGTDSVSAYRLRPSSPAIASGKVIASSAMRDFLGTAIPSCGTVDRGALQTSSNCNQMKQQ